MGRIYTSIIVLLCCTIFLAGTSQAKTPKVVYLRDGGIVECQKVWQANGKVMALVNRDTLVDFSRDEVDLQKTFAHKPAKGVKKGKIRKKAATKSGAVMPQAAGQSLAKPGTVAATAQKTGTAPATKPAPPAVPPSAAQAAKSAQPAAKPAPATVKPAPSTVKPALTAVKPAPPAVKTAPQAVKPSVQGAATSAKKPAPGVAAPLVRTTLPVAKQPAPPPPPAEPSFLASNMANIAKVALLVLLVAGYMIYKKRQKG